MLFVDESEPAARHEGRTLVSTAAWIGVEVRIAAAEALPVAEMVEMGFVFGDQILHAGVPWLHQRRGRGLVVAARGGNAAAGR